MKGEGNHEAGRGDGKTPFVLDGYEEEQKKEQMGNLWMKKHRVDFVFLSRTVDTRG